MSRRTKALSTVLAFVVITALSYAYLHSARKHALPTNALGVRFVGAEAGRIALTNTTNKRLLVQFVAVKGS